MNVCVLGLSHIILIAMVVVPGISNDLQSCQAAQLRCHARSGCLMALSNFFLHCQTVIKGDTKASCPTECKHALVSLLSTEDNAGVAFINCDCHKGGVCSERKERVAVCQNEVLESINVLREDAQPVSCNLARGVCEADTSCLAALQYYYDHCSRLFSGVRCTARCRNSLEILSRQPHASKLRTCKCDGTEDYDCEALKVNTEAMCFHNKRKIRNDINSIPDSGDDLSKESDEPYNKKKMTARDKKNAKRRKRRNRALTNLKKAQRDKKLKEKKSTQRKTQKSSSTKS
ncbi:growth arrest-specific protein 1 [Biomphalaria pfeifferi]|uniref:Growth arrest-specific protein 1 n=1 Tax=Biomphalaria pfeifferi TaxID=112525 RepID=A0AAD8BP46_BIOPF|nr:growth arrest-specific protein 1 [Biomphalaria pfeifferi]